VRERAVGDVGLGVIALVLAGIGAYALLRQACIGGGPGRAFLFGRPAGANLPEID